jgi:hypothetical protein
MARRKSAATAPDPLAPVEIQLRRGQIGPAAAALLPALERRGEEGDRECGLAAALLRLSGAAEPALPLPPDALSATLDRLVQLVQRQEEQIRVLRGLIEEQL